MIHFMGVSHAAVMLRNGAIYRGFDLVPLEKAKLIFVSQDTPTDADGLRNLLGIKIMVMKAVQFGVPVVLTSQVPPGFTRSLGVLIYHQAETLRIRDAVERARNPEQHIVGCENPDKPLPLVYEKYLEAFQCPIHKMTWEEAEYCKIAINMRLIHQVESTNALFAKADKLGLRWDVIRNVLQHDRRIGKYAYTEPGTWNASKHLLRDKVTFESL